MDDVIFVGGRMMLRSRAVAAGLIKGDGAVVVRPPQSVKRGRGRPKGSVNRPKSVPAVDVPTTPDGVVVPVKVSPLRPQNVKKGVPITDDATLAEIVKRTTEIEAARAAKPDGQA